MKVSIITVCNNSEATIESTIKSVLAQDHRDIEYIIIDGKSSDKTLSIIERYKERITKLISEKDQGMYFALNKGIELATGEVIGILNSDDYYSHNSVITRITKEFENPKTDSVYGDLQYVSRSDPQKVIRNWKSEKYDPKLFLKGWMPPHPAFFVRRKFYKQWGGFNTSFSISADYELMLRFLYKHNITAVYIPEILVKMRAGGMSNVSVASRIKANREDRRAWKVNGLKNTPLTLIAKPLSKIAQYFKKRN